MTAFPLDATGLRPALALVAAHGATDLDSAAWVVPYLTCALLPLPGSVLTPLFCLASMLHFVDDAGPRTSVLTHTLALVVGLHSGNQAALRFMLFYLTFLHVPAHYYRCVQRRRHRALLIAALGTALALYNRRRIGTTFVLGHWTQRLVIAHIMTEITHESS